MYFSPNGPVSVTGPAIAAAIQGVRTKGLSPSESDTFVLGTLSASKLYSKQNVAASQVASTVADLAVLPSRLKIPKINAAFTAISSLDGSIAFNIVVGTGSYETTGVAATGTFTITGAPLDTFTNTYVINGFSVVTPQATANSVTAQAAADVLLLNAQSANTGVFATSSAGVITVKAPVGTAGNAITTTSTSSGGDTVTANQAHLASGTNTTGITVAGNDNSSTSGFCTNPAVAGNALFNIDVPITLANFPGATLAGGGSSGLGLTPTFWDAVYKCGAILTLRFISPAGGSVTNFTLSADTFVQPLGATFPSQVVSPAPAVPVPGLSF